MNSTTGKFHAELPHLDIATMSEDWALSSAIAGHWRLLARQLGRSPSNWYDKANDRMYAAVLWVQTQFDLSNPVVEDDEIIQETQMMAVRKPHALSKTTFTVAGTSRVEVSALTCFVKRSDGASNRKLSKVRDLWETPDFQLDRIEDLLDNHHRMKTAQTSDKVIDQYQVNRIQDFNAAGLFYFKNYVRITKAAEWRHFSAQPRLTTHRECWFFGNVDDGQHVDICIENTDEAITTTLNTDDGRRLFLSNSVSPIWRTGPASR